VKPGLPQDPGSVEEVLDALAAQQGVGPVASVADLSADIWDSDEELDAFLAQLRPWRNADLI
jgi:hypothetical protein